MPCPLHQAWSKGAGDRPSDLQTLHHHLSHLPFRQTLPSLLPGHLPHALLVLFRFVNRLGTACLWMWRYVLLLKWRLKTYHRKLMKSLADLHRTNLNPTPLMPPIYL